MWADSPSGNRPFLFQLALEISLPSKEQEPQDEQRHRRDDPCARLRIADDILERPQSRLEAREHSTAAAQRAVLTEPLCEHHRCVLVTAVMNSDCLQSPVFGLRSSVAIMTGDR